MLTILVRIEGPKPLRRTMKDNEQYKDDIDSTHQLRWSTTVQSHPRISNTYTHNTQVYELTTKDYDMHTTR